MSLRRATKTVEISPGVHMPMLGLGTWQMQNRETIFKVMDAALECGYRLIDTAAIYRNESLIGEALRHLLPKYGLERKDVFITSKVGTTEHGPGRAYTAGLRSLGCLGTNYLDLFLIHFPGVSGFDKRDPRVVDLRRGTWMDLEKLKNEGRLRAIGVSNYMVHHLENLHQYATIWPPALNQFEYHPHYKPNDLIQYCGQNGIHFQAYSSFGGPRDHEKIFGEPLVKDLAAKYECSVAQLLLAWSLNQGVSVLPRTTNPDHVRSNFKALDLVISAEDVKALSDLSPYSRKYCWDPAQTI